MVRKYSGLVVKKKYLIFVYAGLSVPTARMPHRTGGPAGKRGLFWNRVQPLDFIQAYVEDSYDLTPRGIISHLRLLDVDYNLISTYGHFGKLGLPWEE